MLDLKRVLASAPRKHEPQEPVGLLTPWGEHLDADRVLQEHPNPQFARDGYVVLNGWWEYAVVGSGKTWDSPREAARTASEALESCKPPVSWDGRILVPFSPEAALSGVGRQLKPGELLWYRRSFECPHLSHGERCVLHFEGVDHAAAVYLNGVFLGRHEGAYLPFEYDATDALRAGSNELTLCVCDPTDAGTQLRGKQRLDNGGIWYQGQSGIWQTVWYEVVPALRIKGVSFVADPRTGRLDVSALLSGPSSNLCVRVFDDQGREVAASSHYVPRAEEPAGLEEGASQGAREKRRFLPEATLGCGLLLEIPNARPWSPADPYLYQVELRYGDDLVHSYCAFRSVEVRADEAGMRRFFLNGEPFFLRGVLDQGYWSGGLLTAPSDEALVFDIQAMRDLGFNMLRKHIKVESSRWYYHCDRLGMLVWQDMPTGGGAYSAWHTSYKPTLFSLSWGMFNDESPSHIAALAADDPAYRREWTDTCLATVRRLGNHPCVVTWVIFNEAWGQFETRKAVNAVREVDPTRPINAASGWYDQACGDYLAEHNYFRDLRVRRDRAGERRLGHPRAFVISEFGGLTYHVDGHSSLERDYGYQAFDDAGAYREAVRAKLAEVDALEAQGLAGYVYTQLSDVEEETNGLLTFDRRVNKLACE